MAAAPGGRGKGVRVRGAVVDRDRHDGRRRDRGGPVLAELQEGLRVADGIDRRGVIDDLSELGIERLLLSDPDLAVVIVDRELGPLLDDARMGTS